MSKELWILSSGCGSSTSSLIFIFQAGGVIVMLESFPGPGGLTSECLWIAEHVNVQRPAMLYTLGEDPNRYTIASSIGRVPNNGSWKTLAGKLVAHGKSKEEVSELLGLVDRSS